MVRQQHKVIGMVTMLLHKAVIAEGPDCILTMSAWFTDEDRKKVGGTFKLFRYIPKHESVTFLCIYWGLFSKMWY